MKAVSVLQAWFSTNTFLQCFQLYSFKLKIALRIIYRINIALSVKLISGTK